MLIFLYGEDTYRSWQKLNTIKEKFSAADKSGANLSTFDGEKIDLQDLRSEILTIPFLNKTRLIIIKNILKSRKTEVLESLIEIIKGKQIPESSVVVFYEEGNPDARKALFKLLTKPNAISSEILAERCPPTSAAADYGEIKAEKFDLLSGFKLSQWIAKEIEKGGGKADQKAVDELMNLAGNDLWVLSGEIKKIISYKKGGIITAQDVKMFVAPKAEENIFNLMDAISNKNKSLALKLLEDQMELDANEIYLLTMLARQFRILLQVKDAMENLGMPANQIASQFKLHPFVVQKSISQCAKFGFTELKKIYRQILDLDLKFKSGSDNKLALLEIFIEGL